MNVMENKMEQKSVFEILNNINCNEHVEKKNNLSYLSWAWAWQIVKSNFPNATYKIYENADGWNYFTDGRTCWVKTGVTIKDLEHIEYLPVMDFRNNSIPADKVTSFDVNKTIQRSLTKACARHGLGLYIYAGEDLPDTDDEALIKPKTQPSAAVRARRATKKAAYKPMDANVYWKVVECYAKGIPTKSGGDYRQTWIETTNAGAEQIAKFDADVDNWVSANMQVEEVRRVPIQDI